MAPPTTRPTTLCDRTLYATLQPLLGPLIPQGADLAVSPDGVMTATFSITTAQPDCPRKSTTPTTYAQYAEVTISCARSPAFQMCSVWKRGVVLQYWCDPFRMEITPIAENSAIAMDRFQAARAAVEALLSSPYARP